MEDVEEEPAEETSETDVDLPDPPEEGGASGDERTWVEPADEVDVFERLERMVREGDLAEILEAAPSAAATGVSAAVEHIGSRIDALEQGFDRLRRTVEVLELNVRRIAGHLERAPASRPLRSVPPPEMPETDASGAKEKDSLIDQVWSE